MLYTMSNQAIEQDIPVHERMEALSLIHDGQRCYGGLLLDANLHRFMPNYEPDKKASYIATHTL
jgi:succinate dehydrogenase/fumarate reductase flavoprotein subunit